MTDVTKKSLADKIEDAKIKVKVNTAEMIVTQKVVDNPTDEELTEVLSPVGKQVDAPIGDFVKGTFNAHDSVSHPQHYKRNPAGIEVIDITEHLNNNQGNAIKYILRAPYKGHLKEDLMKARWYIERELLRVDTYGA